jgi:hypothetical protein
MIPDRQHCCSTARTATAPLSQGEVISPALMNVALHGVEKAPGTRYHTNASQAGWTVASAPVLMRHKPTTSLAIRRIRERLRRVFREMRGATPGALIRRLNQIISGWAAARYFGRFHPTRKDRWIFGDRDSGVYLRKFSWTKIVRHQIVPGGASPDDPALTDYWAKRRRMHRPPLGEPTVRLLHRHCHHQTNPGSGNPALLPALAACLSRVRGKPARPVLRGVRRSNASHLPDPVRCNSPTSGDCSNFGHAASLKHSLRILGQRTQFRVLPRKLLSRRTPISRHRNTIDKTGAEID